MMKKLFNIIMMATALTFWWGCSSSDDEPAERNNAIPVSTPPQWNVELKLPQGETGKPNWVQDDFYQYENTMTAVIRLEDEMTPFVSDEDQMAAIVNEEVREIGYIQHYSYEEGESFYQFMLLIPFAEQDKLADIYYYNAKANQTFKISTIDLRDDNTLGSETDYLVGLFNYGEVTAKLNGKAPFAYQAGDELSLFVDDVCCGTGVYDAAQQQWTVKIYKNLTSKTNAHFRYYSAEKRAVYKTSEIIDFNTLPRSVATPYFIEFI